MRFLLTNDDGIHAPGLAALEEAVAGFGEIHVVAPDKHLSGCSHQVNTDRPLKVTQLAERRHAVDGTPADCTRLGLAHLSPDVDWVLAGVNDGGNLGVDVHMSGTVAAVREATLLGKPGIAFSQFQRRRHSFDWSTVGPLVKRLIDELLPLPLEPGAFWNVNFPDASERDAEPEIVFCELERGHLPVDYELIDGLYHYRGVYQDRPHNGSSDVSVCFSGRIAVTQILPPVAGV